MKSWFKIIWVGLSVFIVINSAFKGEYTSIRIRNDILVKENKRLKEQNKILSELISLKKSSNKVGVNYIRVLSESDADTYVDMNSVEVVNSRCTFGGKSYKFNIRQVFHENKIRAGYQYQYVLANFAGAECYRLGESRKYGSLYNQRYYSQKGNLQYSGDSVIIDTEKEENDIVYADISDSLEKVMINVLRIKGIGS